MPAKRNPIVSLVGQIPARGRVDVKYDFQCGKRAAEAGDIATTRRLARSLGLFAIRHVPLAAASVASAAVHWAHLRSGGEAWDLRHTAEAAYSSLYSTAQGCVIFTQAKLALLLHRESSRLAAVRPEVGAESLVAEPVQHETATVLDKRATDVANGLMALCAFDAAVTLYQDI